MVLEFLAKNWVNLGLVIVGSFAMIIYGLQERKKRIEAASLIVLQIKEIQENLRMLSTYIRDNKLDFGAFYESLPLMTENYWKQYKHYFIKEIDQKSFSDIDLLYNFVSEIQEQQLLLKQLQKESFSLTQQMLINIEGQWMSSHLSTLQTINLMDFLNNKGTLESNISQLTHYMPEQIRISMEKFLKEYQMLEIIGSNGYRRLEKIAKRRF
jgi:hypothetical protein